jgi:DNA ligase (NAD+)
MTEAAVDGENEARQELENINGIGPLMAEDVIDFFAEARNLEVLDDLARAGVETEEFIAPTLSGDSLLADKTVVFTGTLDKMTRSEAKARAEAQGAKVAGSVSARTDYLVAGADVGSKAAKAAALGVKVLSEDQFLALLQGVQPDV